jgi:hypothetical protein
MHSAFLCVSIGIPNTVSYGPKPVNALVLLEGLYLHTKRDAEEKEVWGQEPAFNRNIKKTNTF